MFIGSRIRLTDAVRYAIEDAVSALDKKIDKTCTHFCNKVEKKVDSVANKVIQNTLNIFKNHESVFASIWNSLGALLPLGIGAILIYASLISRNWSVINIAELGIGSVLVTLGIATALKLGMAMKEESFPLELS